MVLGGAGIAGAGVVLFGLGFAGFGLGYLAGETGEAVSDTGDGALKIAAAGGCAVGAYYLWGKL